MKNSSKRLIILNVLAGLALAGAVFAQDATTFTEVKPKLEIPIPGVSFTSTLNDNGNLTLPWIGQYINGIYTFLISIVGLVAAVMMIIGGFQYLTAGGDKGRVDAGRKRITNALIGMVLAFSSYAILYTINPALVEFQGLQLSLVQADPMDEVLTTTEVDTSAESDAGSEGGGGPSAGTHTPAFPDCPLTLPGTSNTSSNKQAFYEQIRTSGKITATTVGEKVVQIADAAVACGMHLGNCGLTAGIFSALATNNQATCLQPGKTCQDFHGTLIHGISSTQRSYLYGRRCNFEHQDEAKNQKYIKSDCGASSSAARTLVRDYLKSSIPGWPDNYVKDLKLGDYVKIYNGNTDLLGSHSLIFAGWASEGKMQTISGSTGKPTHAGTVCVTSKCGAKYQPILYVFRPN